MTDINSLRGIGPERAKDFAKKGIKSAEELLYYLPRGYEDRTQFFEIADCPVGQLVSIKAKIYSPVKETRIKKGFSLYSAVIFDDSGAMNVLWYNNRFLKNAFRSGDEVIFYGRVAISKGKRELQNPIFEKADNQRFMGKIVPIYPLTGNLTQKVIASAVEEAMKVCGKLPECIPEKIRNEYNIPEINFAMKNIHFPESFDSYELSRRRFVFEELLTLQLALFNKKEAGEREEKKPFSDTECVQEFINKLPFDLTGAQKRVIGEICKDFKGNAQMNRLVQGDVGSGKTAVCAAAMYVAVKNGFQAAVMAPTEILATQHYETFTEFFSGTGINICLLTSGTTGKKEIYEKIMDGSFNIIIGTNAIIQKSVEYQNLGLVVADEQHRFGVAQRASLVEKGEKPHTLIMTATPIPRTLSLILYGDLDISIIDELPPGRKPVATYAVGEDMRKRIYAFLHKHISGGSQAYVVCPLIEESEKSDLANATDIYNRLTGIFPEFSVGLIHGKMKSQEKESVMHGFACGKIDILVSTTVIEVGVNVPNSNIMVIENAERFGLSTLHQLRGRVGRGQEEAFCIMFAHGESDITKQRMETMCSSNDGFYISEQDLKLRGPGDFFGTRQHGLPEFRVANLFSDAEILKAAQECAKNIMAGAYAFDGDEYAYLMEKVEKSLPEGVVFN